MPSNDLVSRLKAGSIYVAGVPKTFSAAFDGFGNITSKTTNGSTTSTPTSVATNRLSSGVYDVAGNLTALGLATCGYDRLNMPTQICSSGSLASCSGENWIYAYTADDERILEYRIGGGGYRNSLRDLNGKVLREYFVESAGGFNTFQDYIYRDSTLLASVHPTEGTRWFGPDQLGTPRGVFNSAGTLLAFHTYYPFGEEATSATADTQQMKFTGHERDLLNTSGSTADDTDYMHARQFSLQTARFHSVDPVGGHLRRPGSRNRYAYVLGNPMKYTDPYGLDPVVGPPAPTKADDCGDSNPCDGGGGIITVTGRPWDFPTAPGGPLPPGTDQGGLRGHRWPCGLFGTMCDRTPIGELIPRAQRGDEGAQMELGWENIGALGDPAFDPIELGVTAMAGLFSTIARTAGAAAFFEGTYYSPKVIAQMAQGDFHAFPESVTAFARNGSLTRVFDSQGRSYLMLTIQGSYRGRDGVFEFIKDSQGKINHRFFNGK